MVKRFQPRHAVGVSVFGLLAIGLVMVTSAGLSIEPSRPITMVGIVTSRTAIYAYLALLFLWVGAHLDISRILRSFCPASDVGDTLPPVPSISASDYSVGATHARVSVISYGQRSPIRQLLRLILFHPASYLFLLSVMILVLVHVPGIGAVKNGAARWIELRIGSFVLSMQPSEIAKWAMVIVMPAFVVAMGDARIRRFFTGFLPLLVVLGVVCGLIITEDLGTAVLVGTVGLIVLFAAGVRWWHIGVLLPAPIAAVVFAILSSPYRMERVRMFWNPYADPREHGYHMIQSMTAIAGGHLTGRGLGHGVFKFGYLPEDTTDFLFAVICEEMGIAGAALVVFLYGVLLVSGFMIIKRLRDRGPQLVALGIMLTVGLQAAINLLVVTGLAPTKGIALPLLSAGGTGWILTAFSLGLLMKMDKTAEEGEICAGDVGVKSVDGLSKDSAVWEVETPLELVNV